MATVYVLYWFDVEDCTVPQSDDTNKRLAAILDKYNVRGTFKVVGQKARILEQHVRYDVVDALMKHDIGFHSNWHGLRPQIAEYLGPLDWDEGVAEFERREFPGLRDVRRLFRIQTPVTYGQPGSNWAPHVFPVLRKWGIPTYVSGFGYVGVDCQPFWYGGVLCTSHMYGKRFTGEAQRHLMGLNFELGKPGELEKHKETFSRSLEQLSGSGGLISIINHPCTLVLEQWFSTNMKSRELTEAGYRHFEDFVSWSLSHANVKPTCASELTQLYPDRARPMLDMGRGHRFGPAEFLHLALNLSNEIQFQRLGDITLSAAEAFGLLVRCLEGYVSSREMPTGVPYAPVYNPSARPAKAVRGLSVPWPEFCETLAAVSRHLNEKQAVPNGVPFRKGLAPPEDFLGAVARVTARLLKGQNPPDTVELPSMICSFESYVDEEAGKSAWKGSMMPPDFSAPKLIELAKLEAWTLKPAILKA